MGALGWFSAAFLPVSPRMRNQIGQDAKGAQVSTESEVYSLSCCFDTLSSHEGLSAQLEIAIVSVGLPENRNDQSEVFRCRRPPRHRGPGPEPGRRPP
jgi:hypothetical protein